MDNSRGSQLFACLADANRVILLTARLITLCDAILVYWALSTRNFMKYLFVPWNTVPNIDGRVDERKKCIIICQAGL